MSKLGTLAACLTGVTLGVAIYIFLVMYKPDTIITFTSFLQSIPKHITTIPSWIMSNLVAIIPTIIGVGAVFSKLYNRAKQAQQQITTQKMAEAENQLVSVTAEKDRLEEANTQLESQVKTTSQFQEQILDLQQTNEKLKAQVETLIAEKNQAERMLTAVIPKKVESRVG